MPGTGCSQGFLRGLSVVESKVGGRGSTPRAKPSRRASPSGTEARQLLRHLNAKPLKGLGQHFLIDYSVLERIVSAADLGPGDTVVEVGPGLGILTEELVKRAARVIAIEIDRKLSSAIEKRLSNSHNLTVLNADVLRVSPQDLVTKHIPGAASAPAYKVVANLPYYIAAPILRHFLEASLKPSLMLVMVQKEVAQSIAAGPGGMSILAVSVQVYARPTIVSYVPSTSFHPQPKVDSAILRLDVNSEPAVKTADIASFFQVVRAGFSAPRKHLRNSLGLGLALPPPEVAALLQRADISPQRRPETLSVDEWARLHSVFKEEDKA